MALFNKKMLVIISGAGRGYGKHLALAIASNMTNTFSHIVLLGRNRDMLQATKSEMVKEMSNLQSSGVEKTELDGMVTCYDSFECLHLDSAKLMQFIESSPVADASVFEHLLIIHNAGSLGNVSTKSIDIELSYVSEYMSVNLSSFIECNNRLLKYYGNIPNKTIVQVSSLCAIEAFKSMALYCAGKASRDMFFKVFALENPEIRVLNWAPGPLETEMTRRLKQTSHDKEIQTMFAEMALLTPRQSADKLMEVLICDKYTSGQHVDYFD